MEEGVLIATGRDADVYAAGERLVLRRYRDGSSVAGEARVMAHLSAHGFPVPLVLSAVGPDLVMERLAGPTLLEALESGRVCARSAATTLATLQDRLHAVPAWRHASAGTRLLHLDLHPGNVMLEDHGPVVIDWRNATDGPPDLDAAMTALILAQVAVDPAHPTAELAGVLLSEFLGRTGAHPQRQLDVAVARRAADRNLTVDERARLSEAAERVRAAAR